MNQKPYGGDAEPVLNELYRQLKKAQAVRDAAEDEIADLLERINDLEDDDEPRGIRAVYYAIK